MSTGRFSNSNSAGRAKKRRDKKQKAAMKASIWVNLKSPDRYRQQTSAATSHFTPQTSKAICCLCNRRVSSFCILQIHSCILCSLCALYLSFNHLSCAANASAGANYFGSLLFTVSIGHTELPRLTSSTPPHPICLATICLRFDA